jgi:hypothetical protein
MDSKHNNHFYNKNLQPYANRLRKEMTKAEACLVEVCFTGRQNEKFSIQASTNSIELHCGFYV